MLNEDLISIFESFDRRLSLLENQAAEERARFRNEMNKLKNKLAGQHRNDVMLVPNNYPIYQKDGTKFMGTDYYGHPIFGYEDQGN